MFSWTVNFRQETVGPLVINVVDSGRETKGGEELVSIDQGPLNKHMVSLNVCSSERLYNLTYKSIRFIQYASFVLNNVNVYDLSTNVIKLC